MRNPEHQTFLDHIQGRRQDSLPRDLETTATGQELGWWKQYQVRRAIGHYRRGMATKEELHLISTTTKIVVRKSSLR